MLSRFAPLLCAVTISLVPLAPADAASGGACTLRLGPTTGLHRVAPAGSVRRVVELAPLGMGRHRGECGQDAARRA